MNEVITITDSAKIQLSSLLKKEGKSAIRISIIGGGCSGFTTKYEFSEKQKKDHILSFDGGVVLIDPKTAIFISGATLDFKNDLNSHGFILDNIPNAIRKCGCGESFSL